MRSRHGDRHGWVHVAGAGAGPPRRRPLRPLRAGRGALRDAHRPPRLPRRIAGRDDARHPARRSAGARRERPRGAGGSERTVRHCLEKSPDERFQEARDLAFALESLTSDSAGTAIDGTVAFPTPAAATTAPRRVPRARPRTLAAGGAAALLVAALLAGAWALGARRTAGPPQLFTSPAHHFLRPRPRPRRLPRRPHRGLRLRARRAGAHLAQAARHRQRSGAHRRRRRRAAFLARRRDDPLRAHRRRPHGPLPHLHPGWRGAPSGGRRRERRLLPRRPAARLRPQHRRTAAERHAPSTSPTPTAAARGSSRAWRKILSPTAVLPRRPPPGPDRQLFDRRPHAADLPGAHRRRRLLPPRAAAALADRRLSSVVWVGPEELVYSQPESVAGDISGSSARIVRQNLRTGRAWPLEWAPQNSLVLDLLGPGRLVLDARSPRENLREIPLDPAAGPERWLTQRKQHRPAAGLRSRRRLGRLLLDAQRQLRPLDGLHPHRRGAPGSPTTPPRTGTPRSPPTAGTCSGAPTAAATSRSGWPSATAAAPAR